MKAPFASAIHTVRVEQARCRELAGECRRLGSAGAFGCALIEAAVESAERALSDRDSTALAASLEHLRSVTGTDRPAPVMPWRPGDRPAAGG